MQTKEELNLLRAQLLMAIRYGRTFNHVESKLKYLIPVVTPSSDQQGLVMQYSHGRVMLEDKKIAEITLEKVVIAIDFHGRYDPFIRQVFTWLEVELHRFGSSWMGYPNSEPLTITNKDVAKALEAATPSPAPDSINITGTINANRPNAASFSIPGQWTTTATSGFYNGTSTTASTFFNYYSDGTIGTMGTAQLRGQQGGTAIWEDTSTVDWNAGVNRETARRNNYARAPVVPAGNPPRDPRIRAAQEAGMTQRQIDQMMQRGGRR
jgi:hypothetical protein